MEEPNKYGINVELVEEPLLARSKNNPYDYISYEQPREEGSFYVFQDIDGWMVKLSCKYIVSIKWILL